MIVQDAYFVPNDLAVGLNTGNLARYGSMIRYATGEHKGQIVKNLESINPVDIVDNIDLGPKPVNSPSKGKKGGIIAGIVTGVIVIGGVAYYFYKKLKNKDSKVVKNFKAKLNVYIEAIRSGDMDINKIDDLMLALRDIQNSKDYEKIKINLTLDDLKTVICHIYGYTIHLAELNNYDLSNSDFLKTNEDEDSISGLENNLLLQKKIFESAHENS